MWDSNKGWIGVDLDGTLAYYEGWKHYTEIGAPIKPMVDRIVSWVNNKQEVKIFTARADEYQNIPVIKQWLKDNLYQLFPDWFWENGMELDVTNVKDMHCIEIWDDRAIQVILNTGQPVK